MAQTATDRAALAARFSSAPEHERTAAPEAGPSQIRSIRFTTDLPAGRHHAFTTWLREEAFTLGTSPKWVGLQAAVDELIGLALTDETTARKLHDRLRARIEGQ